MGSVWVMVVIEDDPAPDTSLGLRAGFLSVQIDAFMLQGPSEAFDRDVVDAASLAVSRDQGADLF